MFIFLAGAFAVLPYALADVLQQERVLAITRHGIRVPYPPLAGMGYDVYSTDGSREWFGNFSDWGADQVAALTSHGLNVIYEMGRNFKEDLLANASGTFTIYSAVDSTKRDINTAIQFFRGAVPEANVTEESMYGPADSSQLEYVQFLLNQADKNVTGCPSSATLPGVIAGETGGSLSALSIEQQEAILALSDHLDCCKPELCIHQGNSSFGERCTLMSLPTRWEGQKLYWEDFTGPLTVAGKLMEYVQLLYLNGMAWNKLVPNMTESQLASLMRLHEKSVGIASDYWNAQNAGSELLVHLAATMQQVVQEEDIKGLHSKRSDSLVYYAAHDINIYFIRELLRLNWLTESYNPNQSPPGGMLLFVLYSSSSSTLTGRAAKAKSYYVKAFFTSQSMRQQRDGSKLSTADPASRVFAIIPGCAGGPELSCPFEEFKRLVLKEVKQECVQLVDPRVLADESFSEQVLV